MRGWLLVLCVWLLVWQPLQLGLVASHALASLPIRGWPLGLMLMLRLAVAALGIAAGLALLTRRPAAVALAKVALVLSAATDVLIYTTPFWPNSLYPGDAPLYIAASLAYHGAWLAYLFRSDRVRQTFS